MAYLSWTDRPTGERPVMVVAFEGWNDAGDAATAAVEYLAEQWQARAFAEIDPEDFYDFTSTRPTVRTEDGLTRIIDWPRNTFSWARPPGTGGVVLMRGVEPQLKWRTFCEQVLHVATMLDCGMVLTLGALLADVAHTRPTPVFGNAYDQGVIDALDMEPSHYEGPTGIVGVLHAECADTRLDSASLWAAVSAYVPSAPSAKSALALVQQAAVLLGIPVDTTELDRAAAEYEQEISDLVTEDESTAEYVRHLEEQHDRNAGAVRSADDLVEEVERFLREQGQA
jgi:predicted ATP-grasp superfamily ATP-dependent carboligase